jgi:hypothetical protein
MRHLQSFSIFESTISLTWEQEAFLDNFVYGTWTLNPEGKIDVKGDFLGHDGIEKILDFKGLKFGRVTGDFWCFAIGLKTLTGSPSIVGGDFSCYQNDITSLEGGPEEVGGNYDCRPNDKLVSLKGAPEILKGSFKGPGEIWIPSGGWSSEGILKYWKETEDPKRKALLATLLTKERLQKEIDADPAAALGMLKNYFSDPWFRELDLKWSGKMGPWVDLMGDAGELGF